MQLTAKANDQRPRTNDDFMAMANDQRPRTNDDSMARTNQRGYILLLLMLFVALLAIAAGALAPSIAFRIKRDREEEMIHRGVQYSRAIRRFVKKTGHYPTRLEELENTNNIRFLRRRYKDPITGKDFKLLHVGEVQQFQFAGASAAIGANAGAAGGAALLAGGGAAMLGAAAQVAAAAASTPAPNPAADASADSAAPDASKPDSSQPGSSIGGGLSSGAVFGGGPIVGVASTSKTQSIREFNHKNHYNDWQFIYDPSMDRSNALITTPAQPALQVSTSVQQPNASSPGSTSPGSSTFGSSGSGLSSSPSTFGGMQSAPPAQPTQTPPQ